MCVCVRCRRLGIASVVTKVYVFWEDLKLIQSVMQISPPIMTLACVRALTLIAPVLQLEWCCADLLTGPILSGGFSNQQLDRCVGA